MACPAIFSPFACIASKCFTTLSTTPYLVSSAQCGDMVGDPQVLGSASFSSAIVFVGIAVEHVADCERRDEAVVIAAADRLVEEEMARLLEAGERVELVDAPLHVGMAGLPVVALAPCLISTGSVAKRPVDFTSTTNCAPLWIAERSRASITPTLSAKISSPVLSTTPQRSPSPSKPRPTSRLVLRTASRDGVQHLHVFGIRIVVREGVVELAVERDDLAADRLQHLRREGAGGAVAAGDDDLDAALQLRPVGEIGDIARREIFVELVGAAAAVVELCAEHDLLQPRHLVGAEGQRPVRAHLHAGPAILVVRGGDHGDGRHVEIELGEIGHRRHGKADVVHLAARSHQAGDQRVLIEAE